MEVGPQVQARIQTPDWSLLNLRVTPTVGGGRVAAARKPALHPPSLPSLLRPGLEPCLHQGGSHFPSKAVLGRAADVCSQTVLLSARCSRQFVPQFLRWGWMTSSDECLSSLLEETPGRAEKVCHWPTVSVLHSSKTSSGWKFPYLAPDSYSNLWRAISQFNWVSEANTISYLPSGGITEHKPRLKSRINSHH